MNLWIMTVVALMVGLTTMGALTWAYFAEDRAFRPEQPTRAPEQLESTRGTRESISA